MIWFWKTIYAVMFPDSISGLSNVGPKTMATFCNDILFSSPCSITLRKKREREIQENVLLETGYK